MKTDSLQRTWQEDRTEGYLSSVLLLGLEYFSMEKDVHWLAGYARAEGRS